MAFLFGEALHGTDGFWAGPFHETLIRTSAGGNATWA